MCSWLVGDAEDGPVSCHDTLHRTTPCCRPLLIALAAVFTLASSVSLRLTDLPAGWERSTTPGVEPATPNAAQSAVATANQALGDTYIVGGAVVSRLTPQTTGAPIPTAAFPQASAAVAGRVAKQAG